jgi:hypothetical protein
LGEERVDTRRKALKDLGNAIERQLRDATPESPTRTTR